MSTWYEVKTTEIRTWLVEVEDDQEAADAFDAISSEFVMAEPQEFSVTAVLDEDEFEERKDNIGAQYILVV